MLVIQPCPSLFLLHQCGTSPEVPRHVVVTWNLRRFLRPFSPRFFSCVPLVSGSAATVTAACACIVIHRTHTIRRALQSPSKGKVGAEERWEWWCSADVNIKRTCFLQMSARTLIDHTLVQQSCQHQQAQSEHTRDCVMNPVKPLTQRWQCVEIFLSGVRLSLRQTRCSIDAKPDQHCGDVASVLQTPFLPSLIFHEKRQNMTFGKYKKSPNLFMNNGDSTKCCFLHRLVRCETQHCVASGLPDRSLLMTMYFQPDNHELMYVYIYIYLHVRCTENRAHSCDRHIFAKVRLSHVKTFLECARTTRITQL